MIKRLAATPLAASVAVLTFLLLLAWDITRTYPALPAVLELQLQLPAGLPGRSEPPVASGMLPANDSLNITYLSERTAFFTYYSGAQGFASGVFTFEPGATYPFELQFPALSASLDSPERKGPLRVRLAGQDVMRGEVAMHPTDVDRVFFAENPVGGPTFAVIYRGRIAAADGRVIKGSAAQLAPVPARLRHWLAHAWWHALPAGFLAFGAALVVRRIQNYDTAARTASRHLCFAAGLLVNVVAFTWLMTSGSFQLLYPESAGAFYDFQARSFLADRLDVPAESLGGEVFVVDGKSYGYFGPAPALLRLPFAVFDVWFGHLTRGFLIVYYVVALIGAYRLLWHANRLARGPAAAPSLAAILLFNASTGLGSTLLFLGSRAYVYHEAILCGVAFALWSACFTLQYLEHPHSLRWLPALHLGTLAIQSRAPVGLFALALLGCAGVHHVVAAVRARQPFRQSSAVVALAGLAILSVPAVAYAKLGTLHGNPLNLNPQYTAERLARIEGRSFHAANLAHNFDAYVARPAFETSSRFPFVRFASQRRDYPSAKIDLAEPTVAIPYAMSGLALLTVCAVIAAVRLSPFRLPCAVLLLATLPLAACMLAFIATSHRYTGDFVPPLVIGAALGLAFCDTLLPRSRRVLFTFATLATLFSIVVTLGLSLHFQSELVWGISEQVREHSAHVGATLQRWFGVTAP